jgi:hypothetical protein
MLIRIAITTCLVAATAACGGGLDAGDDPGTGTATLLVHGDVRANPLITNASKSGDFTTEFEIDVTKGGAPVAIDSIVVTSDAGDVTLAREGALGIRWRGAQSGYHEIYRLTIEAGADNVRGVQVDGPAIHHFTAPLPGATVDATMPLVVRWERDEEASIATIDTKELDSVAIGDTGTYTIPVGGLKSKENETESEELRLDRAERVTPAGAVVGSDLRVMVRNQIDLVVAPTGPQ